MTMVKLSSLVDKIKKNNGEPFKSVEIQSFIKFITKRKIVEDVTSLCVVFDAETGLMKNDIMFQEVLTNVFKLIHLTNIELPEFIIESEDETNGDLNLEVLTEVYDLLEEYGIMGHIESKLHNDDIDNTIDYTIEQNIATYNSVSRVLSDAISKLPSMTDIGNLMTTLPEQLKDMKHIEYLKPVTAEVKGD